MGTTEMADVARLIGRVLKSEAETESVRGEVAELVGRFPAYPEPSPPVPSPVSADGAAPGAV
jgi:hypothetical protein